MTTSHRYLLLIYLILVLAAFLVPNTGCAPRKGDQGNAGLSITGPQGPQGPALSVITAPATLQQCPTGGTAITIGSTVSVICDGATGAQGNQGQTGDNGTNGTDGTNGSNGADGTNGTSVTSVQFCPGVTPSYPSTFPELGLCIGGNLYGVYSANGGFLALLTPGVYSSDGINASCIFTISTNCQISR